MPRVDSDAPGSLLGPPAPLSGGSNDCRNPVEMTSPLVERFRAKFEELRGHVHVVSSWVEAGETALSVCRDAGPGWVALAPLPGEMQQVIERAGGEGSFEVVGPRYAYDSLPGAIDVAEVGVSAAEFAVAATGTLVEVSTDDSARLVSALPRVHICAFSAGELVEDLSDASPRLRSIFREHKGACAVSFISGPSRTGDIEMILTLGVHGPEETHAIVVLEGGEAGV